MADLARAALMHFDEFRAENVKRKFTGAYLAHCVDGVERKIQLFSPDQIAVTHERRGDDRRNGMVIPLDESAGQGHIQSAK